MERQVKAPAGNAQIVAAMEAAGVPRACWSVSTTGTGRAAYRDYAQEILGRGLDRQVKTVGYLYHRPTSSPALDAELLAKEFVLAGVRTRYTLFHKFMRDLRAQERDPDHPLEGIYGTGAIVLPGIPLPQGSTVEGSPREYQEAIEYLVSHSYEGGALVFAGPLQVTLSGNAPAWPPVLMRLLRENSRIFEVA